MFEKSVAPRHFLCDDLMLLKFSFIALAMDYNLDFNMESDQNLSTCSRRYVENTDKRKL